MTLRSTTRNAAPTELLRQVARARHEAPEQVTNQEVINFVTANGKKTYNQGAEVALRYGVNLNDLASARRSTFEAADEAVPVGKPDATLEQLSSKVAALTRALPRELNQHIAANVADIHANAERLYETQISAGKTEEQALQARQAYVETEIRTRLPRLDADIKKLHLPPSQQALWTDIKREVSNPGLYAKALAADEAFQETAQLGPAESAEIYGSSAEQNYRRSMKKDPRFAQRILGAAGFYKGPIDGRWNAKLDSAFNLQVEAYRKIRSSLGPLDPKSESVIITLQPQAQAAARRTIHAINADSKRTGVTARLLWGTRTYSQQNQLYAKRPKVTNARGGFSNHNFGIAFDIGLFKNGRYIQTPAAYKTAHASVDMTGLLWGGDWAKLKDTPHYQLPIRGRSPNVRELRALFESGRPLPVGA